VELLFVTMSRIAQDVKDQLLGMMRSPGMNAIEQDGKTQPDFGKDNKGVSL
jgi:hypothetical protein